MIVKHESGSSNGARTTDEADVPRVGALMECLGAFWLRWPVFM